MRLQTLTGSRPSLARMGLVIAVAGALLYSAGQLLVSPLQPVAAQNYPSPPLVPGAPPPNLQTETQNSQSTTVGTGGTATTTTTSSTGTSSTITGTGLLAGSSIVNAPVALNTLASTLTASPGSGQSPPAGGVGSGPVVLGGLQITYNPPPGSGSDNSSQVLLTATIEFNFTGLELETGNPDLVVSNQAAALDLSDVIPVLWNGSKWLTIPGAVKTQTANGKIKVDFKTPPGLVAILRARANVFEAPPQAGGVVLGVSGTNQPAKLASAQKFDVGVIFAGSEFQLRYIPGGPAFVQTMDDLNLSVNEVVLAVRRTSSSGAAPSSGAAAAASTYTVVAGDTLNGIGAKTGVDWMRIATANNLSSPYLLQIGQVLTIPR